MGTMHISLPDQMKAWVEEQARSGRFANSSDYLRDLIRRDRVRVETMAEVRAAVDAGLVRPAANGDGGAVKAVPHDGYGALQRVGRSG